MSQSNTLSARDRIAALLDENSFVEIGKSVHARNTDFNMQTKATPSDGVITGYGTVDSNLVYVFSQDVSVMGGSIGEMHARKISKIYDLAMKTGAPVIGLYDCSGIRLQEATDALDALGCLYMKQTMASGVIPQISGVFGQCGGGISLLTALSDFTFMTENASLFVNAPDTLDGNTAAKNNTSSSAFQSKISGNADVTGEDDAAVLAKMRQLILMLPANQVDTLVYDECDDDLNRMTSDLTGVEDTALALQEITDNGQYFEVGASHAREMVTAFIKMNGLTVGAVANRTAVTDENGEVKEKFSARLTSDGMNKAADFIRFCDAFSVPVITIVNTTGFEASVQEEKTNAAAAAKLIGTYAAATCPKITLLAGEAYGSAYLTMGSGHIGADMVFAYPETSIGMMKPDLAVQIIYSDEIAAAENKNELIAEKTAVYSELQTSPESAAGRGYVDEIIDPETTRQHLIAALEMLYTKRENRPVKKHSTI